MTRFVFAVYLSAYSVMRFAYSHQQMNDTLMRYPTVLGLFIYSTKSESDAHVSTPNQIFPVSIFILSDFLFVMLLRVRKVDIFRDHIHFLIHFFAP